MSARALAAPLRGLLSRAQRVVSVPAIRAAYSRLPAGLRARLSAAAHRAAMADLQFPSLPPVAPPQPLAKLDARPGWRGVNVFGYLRGEFGLGESGRLYTRALIEAGYPVAPVDLALDLPHGFGDRSLEAYLGDAAPYPVNLVFVNPDYLHAAFELIGRGRLDGRYTIACWFWELEEVPESWIATLDDVDEILVASTFVADAFRRITSKPVTCVPLPLFPVIDSGASRKTFGLDQNATLFLTTFDFNSFVARKNPFAVVDAFRRAFPLDRQDVRLLVKSSNGERQPHLLQALRTAIGDDRRILLRDQIVEREHVAALQRCADVYVSLHRAEGFGLGLAECMSQGKPVIGTAWSGNLEFMTPEVSALVPATMVPVGDGEYPHRSGAQWAEPDVDAAASWMRRFAGDETLVSRMGQAARTHIARHLDPRHRAAQLIERLESVGAGSGAQRSTD